MTLVVLAAGMGSRYGGLKQLDPITEHGEYHQIQRRGRSGCPLFRE